MPPNSGGAQTSTAVLRHLPLIPIIGYIIMGCICISHPETGQAGAKPRHLGWWEIKARARSFAGVLVSAGHGVLKEQERFAECSFERVSFIVLVHRVIFRETHLSREEGVE